MPRTNFLSLVAAIFLSICTCTAYNTSQFETQCPDSYTPYDADNKCMLPITDPSAMKSWRAAKEYCRHLETTHNKTHHLVVVPNMDKINAINKMLSTIDIQPKKVWIGLEKVSGGNGWQWVDGTEYTYINWCPTCNNFPSACAALHENYFIYKHCLDMIFFICETPGRLVAKIAPCKKNNGGCQHTCKDTNDGPVCSCLPGFQKRAGNSTQCVMRNWCMEATDLCQHKCSNTAEGPTCLCDPGYEVNPVNSTRCDIKNWCGEGNGGCQHICENTLRGAKCSCYPGYQMRGEDTEKCEDIDECTSRYENGGCQHICTNGEGSWNCSCRVGYAIENVTSCTKINQPSKISEGLILLATCSVVVLIVTSCLVFLKENPLSFTKQKRQWRITNLPRKPKHDADEGTESEDHSEDTHSDEEEEAVTRVATEEDMYVPTDVVVKVPSVVIEPEPVVEKKDETLATLSSSVENILEHSVDDGLEMTTLQTEKMPMNVQGRDKKGTRAKP